MSSSVITYKYKFIIFAGIVISRFSIIDVIVERSDNDDRGVQGRLMWGHECRQRQRWTTRTPVARWPPYSPSVCMVRAQWTSPTARLVSHIVTVISVTARLSCPVLVFFSFYFNFSFTRSLTHIHVLDSCILLMYNVLNLRAFSLISLFYISFCSSA